MNALYYKYKVEIISVKSWSSSPGAEFPFWMGNTALACSNYHSFAELRIDFECTILTITIISFESCHCCLFLLYTHLACKQCMW